MRVLLAATVSALVTYGALTFAPSGETPDEYSYTGVTKTQIETPPFRYMFYENGWVCALSDNHTEKQWKAFTRCNKRAQKENS